WVRRTGGFRSAPLDPNSPIRMAFCNVDFRNPSLLPSWDADSSHSHGPTQLVNCVGAPVARPLREFTGKDQRLQPDCSSLDRTIRPSDNQYRSGNSSRTGYESTVVALPP